MKARPSPRDPCHCGSSKQYRHCHGKGRVEGETRPRNLKLYVNPGDHAIESSRFHDNDETGEVTLLCDGVPTIPEQAFMDYGYTKPNGKRKTTLRVPFVDKKMTRDPLKYIEERFEGLIAIDTNTVAIGQETVSVTAAIVARVKKGSNGSSGDLVIMKDLIIEFRDPTENAERVGWWEVFRTMAPRPPGIRCWGVVTDCDMNTHPLINARLQPIREKFFLPPEFSMFYASTDSAADSAINRLLRSADQRASDVLAWIKANAIDAGWETLPPNAPYRRIRRWRDDALDKIFRDGHSLSGSAPAHTPGAVPSVTTNQSEILTPRAGD